MPATFNQVMKVFQEGKHRRVRGKFADIPGKGDDAPKKGRKPPKSLSEQGRDAGSLARTLHGAADQDAAARGVEGMRQAAKPKSGFGALNDKIKGMKNRIRQEERRAIIALRPAIGRKVWLRGTELGPGAWVHLHDIRGSFGIVSGPHGPGARRVHITNLGLAKS
jgi:hypothetical protein